MGITFSELIFGNPRHEFLEGSRVMIKFTNSASVPRYMIPHLSRRAFLGWFSAIVSTEYDVYINVKPPNMDDPKRNFQNDDRKSNLTSSTLKTSDNDEQPGQRSEEHPEEEGDDGGSKESSKKFDLPENPEHDVVLSMTDRNIEEDDEENDDGRQQTMQTSGYTENGKYPKEVGGEKVIQHNSGPRHRYIYYIYKVSSHRRQKLLQYAAFTAGHLGVFAFLFQVFDDRGAIMQICCYGQLAVLLLCFILYAGSYILDIMVVLKIIQDGKTIETILHEVHGKKIGVGSYIHRIFAVNEVDLSPEHIEEKQGVKYEELMMVLESLYPYNSYTSPILDILFAVFAMAIECLTIAYIYNNTRGDDQGQDGKSQQT